jgi:uncharacterized protein YdeI (YjbR/CyaY-like superfamily)
MEVIDSQIKFFDSQPKWRTWLEKNHSNEEGIWLKFYKKASGKKTLVYSQALDEALCFGWIDGQAKSLDSEAYLQRFTPRRSKSPWSKINKGHVARLIKEGKMTDAGLKQIEAAKADGRWDQAYDSPSTSKVPDGFISELKKDKTAFEFFEGLTKSNKFAISYQLQTAKKPETRERRKQKLIDMLRRGEKLY